MRCRVAATDNDGTLAKDGRVSPRTLAACRRLRESGRKLLLVIGRELPELNAVFSEWTRFDLWSLRTARS